MNTYMTIFVNVKNGNLEGAFKAELEKIPEKSFQADLEYLEDQKKGPELSAVTKTYSPTIYCTNPVWIIVGGRLKCIG